MPKTLKKRRGGALNYSEYRGGANMEEELEDDMVGGKLRRRGGTLNYSEYLGGAPLHDNKLGDMMKGGSKRRRKRGKSIKRGGSTLGGMFGGMNSVTGTINSLFGTKF